MSHGARPYGTLPGLSTTAEPLDPYVLLGMYPTAIKVQLAATGSRAMPALLICDGSSTFFHRELLASSLKFTANGWSSSHIDRYVLAMRGLTQYYFARGAPTLDENSLVLLVWDYLSARLYGTTGVGEGDELQLFWKPNRWSTVRHDCRAIADYSDYCSSTYGDFPLLKSIRVPHKAGGYSFVELQKLKSIVESSLLGHLRLLGKAPMKTPMPGRRQPSTSGLGRAVMTEQQAWDLIDADKNPVLRMIWLLGFFGGPRISEQLNMWRNDVLPGDCRELLFRDDPFRENCLVVLANPWESTYCTSLGDATKNRRQYLRERYARHPRPDLKQLDGGLHRAQWAGWKSMLETNENRHISQVFWSDPEAAAEYWRLHQWLMERHGEIGTSKRHPYLYINTDTRRPESVGEPITLSNVGKSFERAVKRIGLEPYRFGANRHGMRHFYKQYLQERGMSPMVRKLFMRHVSIESQNAYGGLNAQAVRNALHVGRRRQGVQDVE